MWLWHFQMGKMYRSLKMPFIISFTPLILHATIVNTFIKLLAKTLMYSLSKLSYFFNTYESQHELHCVSSNINNVWIFSFFFYRDQFAEQITTKRGNFGEKSNKNMMRCVLNPAKNEKVHIAPYTRRTKNNKIINYSFVFFLNSTVEIHSLILWKNGIKCPAHS